MSDAEDFLLRQGYRRCDIMACNCGGWHGGHAMQRLMEIHDLLMERGAFRGTILASVQALLPEPPE